MIFTGGTRAGSPGTWRRSCSSSASTWAPSSSARARVPRGSSPSPSSECPRGAGGWVGSPQPHFGDQELKVRECPGAEGDVLGSRVLSTASHRPSSPSSPSSHPQRRRSASVPCGFLRWATALLRPRLQVGVPPKKARQVATGLGPSCEHRACRNNSPRASPRGHIQCPSIPVPRGRGFLASATGAARRCASRQSLPRGLSPHYCPFPAQGQGAGAGPRPARHFLTLLISN